MEISSRPMLWSTKLGKPGGRVRHALALELEPPLREVFCGALEHAARKTTISNGSQNRRMEKQKANVERSPLGKTGNERMVARRTWLRQEIFTLHLKFVPDLLPVRHAEALAAA